MIAQFTVEFGINSMSNALNSIRLMLFRALLVLLIPNTTVNCAITYTNVYSSHLPDRKVTILPCVAGQLGLPDTSAITPLSAAM